MATELDRTARGLAWCLYFNGEGKGGEYWGAGRSLTRVWLQREERQASQLSGSIRGNVGGEMPFRMENNRKTRDFCQNVLEC